MRVQAFDSSEPPPEYNQDAEEELNTADLHNNPESSCRSAKMSRFCIPKIQFKST